MTIAKTGNRIVDAQARRGAAEAKREAGRAKSASKKSGGGGGRKARFSGAIRAGKSANSRAAKGMKAKYLGKGKSAGGAVDYSMKDDAELIESNCGFDRTSITDGLSPKQRSEIKDQIVHMSFSTPANAGKATAEQWRDRVEFIRKSIGLDDSFAFAAFRHNDTDNDHIHLLFNRVNDQGNLWKDNQIAWRLAALEQRLEQKFDLKLTAREDFQKRGNMNKKTYEMACRTGVEPDFLFVQKAIIKAKEDKPDVITFIGRLADQGIAVRPNLKQGELNGFGYGKDGHNFTGKALGVNWSELKKEVTYVTAQHYETLASLKQHIDAGATRPTQQVGPAAPTPAATPSNEPRTERADRKPDPVAVQSSSIDRLAQLHSVATVRSSRYESLRRSLASYTAIAKLQSASDHAKKTAATAEKLATAMTPDRNDIEVAKAFMESTGASHEARELMKKHLVLSDDERTEVLIPYLAQMKTEAEYMRRMDEADRYAPAPEHNNGNGNTFTM